MLKRAIQFAVIYWVIIFVVVSVLLFVPRLSADELWLHLVFWLLLVPITLGLARWYFREVDPTPMNGVKLWSVAMIIGFFLDNIITVPLFISQQYEGNPILAFQAYYANIYLYTGFIWSLLLLMYAGYEFDRPPVLK